MLDIVVFDIETKETFEEVGGHFPEKLSPSLVCLYSFNKGELRAFSEEEFSELWPYFEQAGLLVGFNSDSFDIPILSKFYPPLLEIPSLDLLSEIKESAGHRVKLDSVAEATLGNNKIADGLEAIKMYKEGRIKELKEYGKVDVQITKDIYLFGKEKGYILAGSFSGPKKIPVNFQRQIKEPKSKSLSLGF